MVVRPRQPSATTQRSWARLVDCSNTAPVFAIHVSISPVVDGMQKQNSLAAANARLSLPGAGPRSFESSTMLEKWMDAVRAIDLSCASIHFLTLPGLISTHEECQFCVGEIKRRADAGDAEAIAATTIAAAKSKL
jgi:hypothetical protein